MGLGGPAAVLRPGPTASRVWGRGGGSPVDPRGVPAVQRAVLTAPQARRRGAAGASGRGIPASPAPPSSLPPHPGGIPDLVFLHPDHKQILVVFVVRLLPFKPID